MVRLRERESGASTFAIVLETARATRTAAIYSALVMIVSLCRIVRTPGALKSYLLPRSTISGR